MFLKYVVFQDSLSTGVIKLGSKYLSLNFQDCVDSNHVITNIQGGKGKVELDQINLWCFFP